MILRNKDDDVIESREKPGTEINEVIANMKLSEAPPSDELLRESTESILTGDIFFSKVQTALQKNPPVPKNNIGNNLAPNLKVASEIKPKVHEISSSSLISNTKTSSIYTTSNLSSKWSTSGSNFKNFTANRQKNQTDGWIACIRGGSCRRSKSPEQKPIDEALFIEKAFVVEEVRQFWADKHQPRTLDKLICNRNQAQHLKNLISPKDCPNILLKGPSGSGKKSLAMALLHEIFGGASYKVSHDLRHFLVQDTRPIQFSIPVSSSTHHLEIDLMNESEKIRYALMAIVKETITNRTLSAEVSDSSFKAEFKVLVLHGADKVTENVQHLVKWVMDCYSDACKIILCCENDTNILDSVKKRCKVITVTSPDNHTIVEVLNQVAKKERIELPTSFAERIASKSKKNLRHAIMALEACKAHKYGDYPFVDEQPILLGWEEALIELAAEILDDPSPQRLFTARAMFQRLLGEFVHPRLILLIPDDVHELIFAEISMMQKLVEQFLKGIETSLKRELYYWHAYYDKRLPRGTNALLKLEEFIAKFLSISRRSLSLVNSANGIP
ncbi:putative DNA polymerase III, clamp loader complex, gamma/delta/delta subunit [Dioscorea sansibarensis]